MRPLPQVGANLPLVVKPDHLREDRPGCPANQIRPVVEMAASWYDPVYVVLTDGERTVNIPVQSAGYNGHVLHLYAEVTP